jgi:hypothetical protein
MAGFAKGVSAIIAGGSVGKTARRVSSVDVDDDDTRADVAADVAADDDDDDDDDNQETPRPETKAEDLLRALQTKAQEALDKAAQDYEAAPEGSLQREYANVAWHMANLGYARTYDKIVREHKRPDLAYPDWAQNAEREFNTALKSARPPVLKAIQSAQESGDIAAAGEAVTAADVDVAPSGKQTLADRQVDLLTDRVDLLDDQGELLEANVRAEEARIAAREGETLSADQASLIAGTNERREKLRELSVAIEENRAALEAAGAKRPDAEVAPRAPAPVGEGYQRHRLDPLRSASPLHPSAFVPALAAMAQEEKRAPAGYLFAPKPPEGVQYQAELARTERHPAEPGVIEGLTRAGATRDALSRLYERGEGEEARGIDVLEDRREARRVEMQKIRPQLRKLETALGAHEMSARRPEQRRTRDVLMGRMAELRRQEAEETSQLEQAKRAAGYMENVLEERGE